jgi:hypothetical protein
MFFTVDAGFFEQLSSVEEKLHHGVSAFANGLTRTDATPPKPGRRRGPLYLCLGSVHGVGVEDGRQRVRQRRRGGADETQPMNVPFVGWVVRIPRLHPVEV